MLRCSLTATVMLFVGFTPGFVLAALPKEGHVAVQLRAQETNEWCWASSGQMVMAFLSKKVTQCDEADQRFGRTDCCGASTPIDCIRGGWPEFDKYGFTFAVKHGALTWDELRTEIATNRRPFAFSWMWRQGGGHMMVVTGFYEGPQQKQYVSINDPWPPNIGDERDILYDAFVEGADHTHWDDYYLVAREQPGSAKNQKDSVKDEGSNNKDSKDKSSKKAPSRPRGGVVALPNKEKDVASSIPVAFKTALTESHAIAEDSVAEYREIAARKEGPGAANMNYSIGQPFPQVFVGLEDLRGAPIGEPDSIIRRESSKVLYPIQADGVRAAVTIAKKDDHWEPISFGNKALMRLLVDIRAKYAKENDIELSDFYTVAIPALNLHFVATDKDSGRDATLISVIDDRKLKIVAGKPEKASDLMPRLIEAAKQHDGLPR